MPPSEIREKPEPEVWLEDSTWTDVRRPRRRDDASVDPVVITISTGDEPGDELPPFYDHAAGDRYGGPDATDATDATDTTDATASSRAPRAPRAPFTPAEPAGEVPGLLRRPLVEVQRTPPRERDVDRPRFQSPDRVALLAVALAIVTLLAAIVTAQG